MSIEDELSEIQFAATTSNILTLHHLVSSILPFGKNCLLTITEDGICFSIMDNNICKIILNLDRKLFSNYVFNPLTSEEEGESDEEEEEGENRGEDIEDVEMDDNLEKNQRSNRSSKTILVHLDLKSFIETINIHISSDREHDSKVKCVLSYKRDGYPFVLTFEDELMIERSELLTLYLDDENQYNDVDNGTIFQIDSTEIIFEVVLKSSILFDVLKDMNDLRTKDFIIYCSKESAPQSANNVNGNSVRFAMDQSKKLVFLSKSEDDSIGYSKLMVPNNNIFLKNLEIWKPIFKDAPQGNDDPTDVESDDESNLLQNEVVMKEENNTNISSFYNFAYFSKIIKSIRLSNLIKIRKDLRGITSLSMLIDANSLGVQYKPEISGESHGNNPASNYLGTSIEFITLESVPIEERLFSNLEPQQSLPETLGMTQDEADLELQSYGFYNKSIQKLIKDDENIKIIKVSGNGQLTTLDDFYKPVRGSNDYTRRFIDTDSNTATTSGNNNNYGGDLGNDEIGIVPVSINTMIGQGPISNQLESLMNFTSSGGRDRNARGQNSNNMDHLDGDNGNHNNHESDHEQQQANKKRKGGSSKASSNNKKKSNKKGGDKEEVQTVGGAIEIPLFI